MIDMSRVDDRVIHGNPNFLKTIKIDGRRYFSIDDSYMKPQVFPVEKPKETIRVILMGGSFVLGEPYVAPKGAQDLAYLGYGGISSWLVEILKRRVPSNKFEIINAGINSANISTVTQAFEQLVHTNPDWVILLSGNNEGFVPVSNFNKSLQEWIVYRALKKTILPTKAKKDRPFFPPQVDNNLEVAQFFQENIVRFSSVGKKEKINLLLGTLPINLKFEADFLPGFGKPLDYPKDDPNLIAGKEFQKKKQYEKAIHAFAQSENQIYATRHIAQCFEASGDIVRAREFYRVYVEGNPRGQTRPSFNQFIRDYAKRENIPLVDFELALEKKYPDRIPEKEVFVDNCHLNWQHYFWVASELTDVLIASGKLVFKEGEPKQTPDPDKIIHDLGWEELYIHKPPIWGQQPESNASPGESKEES